MASGFLKALILPTVFYLFELHLFINALKKALKWVLRGTSSHFRLQRRASIFNDISSSLIYNFVLNDFKL